jgi:hypothetical protein
VRASESRILSATKNAAARLGSGAVAAMTVSRARTGKAVTGGQQETKSADETRRAQVAATLQKVFDATKQAVEEILTGLDAKVDAKFTAEEKAARDAFTAEHKQAMAEYKDKRYSGLDGAARWVKDKLFDLPEEANAIFAAARQNYVKRMRDVITSVADLVGTELGRARARIAEGRAQLKAEVDKLPEDLRALGRQTAGQFERKFDELGESVKNKGQGLVQTLASKYTEALSKVDEEIAAEKEKNKGFVAKAVAAVGGVVKTILQLKDMLLGVLAKAASAVAAILKDPIGFLGNLVSAVGAGLRGFLANIVEHLKKGLFGWLLGAASSMGLQIPAKFDLRGILGMLATLFGLTWSALRGRIVQRLLQRGISQRAITAIEGGVAIVQKLRAQGLAGVLEEIKDKIGDLKENLVGKLTDYLVPTVLKAGIFWILSLLNPASAFVKACKAILDFVQFVMTRGAQIMEFVNSILDAVIAMARGSGGGVPALVEKALARSVPVLIGALAALLGIGGIANKVKEFVQSLSKPVMKAVDWLVDKVVGLGKGIWERLMARARRVKEHLTRRRKPETAQQKQRRLDAGATAAVTAVDKYAGRPIAGFALKPLLTGIRLRHRLALLHVVPHGEDGWAVHGVVNPQTTRPTRAKRTSGSARATLRTRARTRPKPSGLDPSNPPSGVAVLSQADRDELAARWRARAASTDDSVERARYMSYASSAERGTEPPDPRASEQEVKWLHESVSARSQVSYLSNREVPAGTPGSTRPDLEVGGWSVETKRYILKRQGGQGKVELIAELRRQYSARLESLPAHKQLQGIIVDVRGQYLKADEIQALRHDIFEQVVQHCYSEAKAAGKWWVHEGATGPGPDSVTVLAGDVG